MTELKQVCKEFNIKISGGSLVRRRCVGELLATGRQDFFSPSLLAHQLLLPVQCLHQQLASIYSNSGPLSSYGGEWKKDLSPLSNFTFMDLFTYLVESRDKTFDHGSMKAFKSLKAYRYFADGYIQHAWATEVCRDLVIVRCYCFSSLKSAKTYPVFVCLSRNGDVYSAECKCVAG